MLFPAFSRAVRTFDTSRYVLPEELARLVTSKNAATDTAGPELRLQSVYGDEIWRKLSSLGLEAHEWKDKDVLDVCCGSGFLSYHLLSRTRPRSLTMNELSRAELSRARELIDGLVLRRAPPPLAVEYVLADAIHSDLPGEGFDLVVGNSFLHHFSDVPAALREFHRLLRKGGRFITVHEPTIGATALESANHHLLRYMVLGERYLQRIWYQGDGISPEGGSDVWMFTRSDLQQLLAAAGFVNIKLRNWHCLRPLVVTLGRMHLCHKKPTLNRFDETVLRGAVSIDAVLSRCAPASWFGSICVLAEKSVSTT
jgi:ubiquinone/menaquinone biosynthesis C-methylase UbiE